MKPFFEGVAIAVVMIAFFVTAVLLMGGVPGCASGPRRVAHVSIVTSGALVAAIDRANVAAYVEATDALREGLAEAGGLAHYASAVRPYDDAFDARTLAVAALSDALFAAAALNDLGSQATPAQLRAAAARVLQSIDRALDVLQDARILPVVRVPRELRSVVQAMQALAGPVPAPARALDAGGIRG